jgi:predicted Holliday junction resolvase-like endonuclease
MVNLIIVVLVVIIIILTYSIIKLLKKLDEVTFKLRSQSVKHGKSWEHFVPFTKEFEKIANKENFVFIGQPIDGISFDENEIKFIEIKTGKSRLSEKQRKLKSLIEKKKVKWIELRY